MTEKSAECDVCGRQSDCCSSLYLESNGKIYCAGHQGFSRLSLPWKTSDRGMTAEVVDDGTTYLVHAVKDEKHPEYRIAVGSAIAVERRLTKKGGPGSWLKTCTTRAGEAPWRSVSAPCVVHLVDLKLPGEAAVFLMLVEEKRDLELGDTHIHIDHAQYPAIDVEEFARRKGCSPTDGREYLAAQQAARGVKLADFTARSVWEIAKDDGGYVRDILDKRYCMIHARGRDLREEELEAISQVAEEPPLEPLDLTGPKPIILDDFKVREDSVPPAFAAVERAFGMDPKNRKVEQLTPDLPD